MGFSVAEWACLSARTLFDEPTWALVEDALFYVANSQYASVRGGSRSRRPEP
jgi:hypothetical protein